MSHEPDPRSLQVGRVSQFGARPQPLNPVMDPYSTLCPACNTPLVEHIGVTERIDYVRVDNFDPPGYYHRQCLTRLLAEYTAKIQQQGVNEQ